ncbi:hypothetical protein [Geminicoccus flavidas]|uniref:hypothetical protein n=1 Tax=Geminicoccus flavidas TaxID=2506407 RepID=UPI00135A4B33|nr:hypothetical protein [Geminicoccus flavidas]
MADDETNLEQARRHVREATSRLAEQRTRIAELERDGHEATRSRELLVTMEDSFRLMQEHLEVEEQEARQAAAASPGT